MTTNIDVLRQWIYIVASIAAICTTAVPLIYSFFPWWQYTIGKLIFAVFIAFALLMDVTMLGVVWKPTNILMIFWIDAFVLTFIAVSTASVAILMLRLNYFNRKKGTNNAANRQGV